MRKTKIVCTLGPATDRDGVLEALVDGGMDVARFNFSHGPHEEQKGRLDHLKQLREEKNRPIAALLDTKGPEIRTGCFAAGKVELKEGQTFTLYAGEYPGDENGVSVSYAELYKDVAVGSRILIDDGLVEMIVTEIRDQDIVCQVENGGVLSDKKGVNVPGSHLNMPFISEKDYGDILFGIQEGFDFIACSFTRTAADIREIKSILQDNGCTTIRLIAKIENQQGVDNIDEIIKESDGVMVARGDMGVEIPLEEVPVIQNMIIKKVFMAGKQVITATQMLDSMMKNPRPTRAETTDVAYAIYQGTSAIMLSGETASGRYPVESLKTMDRIARRIEADIDYNDNFNKRRRDYTPDISMAISHAISHATCMTAMELEAAAIVSVTKSGATARMISRFRPGCTIVGCTTDAKVQRQMNMSWGVYPLLVKEEYSTEVLFLHAVEAAEKAGYVNAGDVVVLTAGIPLGKPGSTNMIKAVLVGE